jgi:hypothetical protein
MNSVEMSAYWMTLSVHCSSWKMPIVGTDEGDVALKIWCKEFAGIPFADAIGSLSSFDFSGFPPELCQLVAAARGDHSSMIAAGECFGRLRSVINSCGTDVDQKREMCDRIDPYMWATIQAIGGWDFIRKMEEPKFNNPHFLKDWSNRYVEVAAGTRANVLKRKGIAASLNDSLGQIMKSRPQIEGGFA